METHYPIESTDDELRCGGLYTIHRRMHRLLATVSNGFLLADVASHHLHLVQHPGGEVGLPTASDVRDMLATGVMAPVDPAPAGDDEIGRMEAEIALLDGAKVRNGEKSIWLHLSAVWSEDLLRRFGPFDDPATIRRWRTTRRNAAKATRRVDAD